MAPVMSKQGVFRRIRRAGVILKAVAREYAGAVREPMNGLGATYVRRADGGVVGGLCTDRPAPIGAGMLNCELVDR